MSETTSQSLTREITFVSDQLKLKGVLHLPADTETPPPVVIGSHGLFSNAESPKQLALADALNRHGIAFFRYDHRGCGRSEGFFDEVTSWEGRCNDLNSAIRTMREWEETSDRIGLFGSSFGGSVSLHLAKKAGAEAVVTFAAATRSTSLIKYLKSRDDSENNTQKADLGRIQFDIFEKIVGIHHVLIFHGDSDRVIGPSEAHRIYQQAVMPKRLIMQRDGDHRMSLKENQDKFLRESVQWFQAYLKNKGVNTC